MFIKEQLYLDKKPIEGMSPHADSEEIVELLNQQNWTLMEKILPKALLFQFSLKIKIRWVKPQLQTFSPFRAKGIFQNEGGKPAWSKLQCINRYEPLDRGQLRITRSCYHWMYVGRNCNKRYWRLKNK